MPRLYAPACHGTRHLFGAGFTWHERPGKNDYCWRGRNNARSCMFMYDSI